MLNNPLEKYYRTRIAGSHTSLPSGGRYGGDIEFNMANEVEVYALTASDEIYVTNPESLISGAAIERIISSCCPSVRDVKNLPTQDVDLICLVVKKVSYGNIITLPGKCSNCGHEQEHRIDIDNILSLCKILPEEVICEVDGLKIYLKPHTLEISNYISAKEFEQNKILDYIQKTEDDPDEKAKKFFDTMKKIKMLNLDCISNNIIRIITEDDEQVVDENIIKEYITNAPVHVVKNISEKIKIFSDYGLPSSYEVSCSECEHQEHVPLIYDPTSFFA